MLVKSLLAAIFHSNRNQRGLFSWKGHKMLTEYQRDLQLLAGGEIVSPELSFCAAEGANKRTILEQYGQ